MPTSNLLHLESEFHGTDGYLSYTVFSCLQWQRPNLELMHHKAEHKFAIMHAEPLDERDIKILEWAYVGEVLRAVNLIAKHETSLVLFLDSRTSSLVFPAIESAWTRVAELDPHWRFDLTFANEAEVLSGHSDYPFCKQAKAIIEGHSLGIKLCDLPLTDPAFVNKLDFEEKVIKSGAEICLYNVDEMPANNNLADALHFLPVHEICQHFGKDPQTLWLGSYYLRLAEVSQ